MQGSIALVSGGLGLAALWLNGDWRWIAGAMLIPLNWPYPIVGIRATNHRLDAIADDKADAPRARSSSNGDSSTPVEQRSAPRQRLPTCGRSVEVHFYSAGTGCGALPFSTSLTSIAIRMTAMRKPNATNAVAPSTRPNPPRP